MALINRMSRLLTADMHAVLDRMEEPDVLLRQAVREMEEELVRSEQRVKLLEHERDRLADRNVKVEAALTELGDQVGVAFDSGNEELARKLVRRKLETASLAKHVSERRAHVAKSLAEAGATLAEQRERLDVMRQKCELLAESAHVATVDEWGKTEFTVAEDEVEVAFLREKQRRTKS
jgi:phage shock protein A